MGTDDDLLADLLLMVLPAVRGHRNGGFMSRNLLKCATLASVLLLLGPSGCGTFIGFAGNMEDSGFGSSKVYIGSRVTLSGLTGVCAGQWQSILLMPFLLADLPLSFVLDTLLLPYTLYSLSAEPEVIGWDGRATRKRTAVPIRLKSTNDP